MSEKNKILARCKELKSLGLVLRGEEYTDNGSTKHGINVHVIDIQTYDEEKWNKTINRIKELLK